MRQRVGVMLGILSCSFGAGGAVATRMLVGTLDPVTIAAIRFGGGFLVLLPLALVLPIRWPDRRDWPAVALLGFSFYGVFFIFYNLALGFTTVARGTLALATLPLMTMMVAAVLGREALSASKATGVLIAMMGVAFALGADLSRAPPGAWRGDLIMLAATLCMAVYSIHSRPYVARSSPMGFLIGGMGVGGSVLMAASLMTGGAGALASLNQAQWLPAAYLALGAGAIAFVLWIYALQYATPTRVTNTMTFNPFVAGIGAYALLGEPLSINFAIGLVAVFMGILIATRETATGGKP